MTSKCSPAPSCEACLAIWEEIFYVAVKHRTSCAKWIAVKIQALMARNRREGTSYVSSELYHRDWEYQGNDQLSCEEMY